MAKSHNFRNNKLATQRPGDPTERESVPAARMTLYPQGEDKVLLLSNARKQSAGGPSQHHSSPVAMWPNDTADSAFPKHSVDQGHVVWRKRNSPTQRPPGQRRPELTAIGGDFRCSAQYRPTSGCHVLRGRDESPRKLPKSTGAKAIHAAIDLQRAVSCRLSNWI